MPSVLTRDEAIESVSRALDRWAADVVGALVQGQARVKVALDQGLLQQRETERAVDAAQRDLAAAKLPSDAESRARRLAAAIERRNEVGRHVGQLRLAVSEYVELTRRLQTMVAERVPAAAADLQRRSSSIGRYRLGGGTELPGGQAGAQTNGSSPSQLLGRGVEMIDVDSADFSDNPVIGEFGRGGASRSDYRWAVETWANVVEPRVRAGADRSEFERRDGERSAPAFRSTAAVYDMFLGDTDRIRVSERPDGSLDVANGRHRLEVARELGIRQLPAQVTRR